MALVIFKHLAAVAKRYECAIVLIAHLNKTASMKAAYRMLGSVDITAAARSILIVGRIKNNPTVKEGCNRVCIRLFHKVAKNLYTYNLARLQNIYRHTLLQSLFFLPAGNSFLI